MNGTNVKKFECCSLVRGPVSFRMSRAQASSRPLLFIRIFIELFDFVVVFLLISSRASRYKQNKANKGSLGSEELQKILG